ELDPYLVAQSTAPKHKAQGLMRGAEMSLSGVDGLLGVHCYPYLTWSPNCI
ncbi:hypothetical protein A2U01_0083041, partial [Trifolium medium]|nr:hypothetical protein [Trifolium medium]